MTVLHVKHSRLRTPSSKRTILLETRRFELPQLAKREAQMRWRLLGLVHRARKPQDAGELSDSDQRYSSGIKRTKGCMRAYAGAQWQQGWANYGQRSEELAERLKETRG
jgi:hypothetical protein